MISVKRIISLIIASAMLLCAAPALSYGEDNADAAPLTVDACAPAEEVEGAILIDGVVSASELLSYFEEGASLFVVGSDGASLDMADEVPAGSIVTNGVDSVTVAVRGDPFADGKFNARDVIAAIKVMLGSDFAESAAADVNCDGAINSRDVISMMRRLVGYDEPFGEAGLLAKGGDSAVSVYFDSLMHRVGNVDMTVYGSAMGEYFMAKSETEDAQLYITSTKQIKDVSVEIGALANAAGDALDVTVRDEYSWGHAVYESTLDDRRFSTPTQKGGAAEALPKLTGAIDLQQDECRGVVFQVMTDPYTASGWYMAPVALRAADGTVIKEAVLRFYVWDFVLDEAPAMDSAFGFSFDSALKAKAKEDAKKLDVGYLTLINTKSYYDEAMPQIIESYMQFFLDARISPYHLPYSVTDPRCDEIMSNPRITSFCVDGAGNYHEALKSAIAKGEWITSDSNYLSTYRKLAQNEDWLHKAYVYYVDEPSPLNVGLARVVKEHIDGVFNATEDLAGIEWHQLVPMGGNDVFTDEFGIKTDENDYVYRYVDIMIPQTYAFTRWYSNTASREFKKQYGYDPLGKPGIMTWLSNDHWSLFPEQWQTRYDRYADEQGLRRWWYICCSPEMPYPNFFTYYQGASQRVVLWQQYMFHVEGLLYWATQDQWDNTNLRRFPTNGDGVLLYWGELFGQSGPVPSIRWEYIRDGIEDFQYFSQLESAGVSRDEIVSKYINRVTTSILEYEEDPDLYEDVRIEIGFALERASNAD